ncbi:hypothetical protein PPGU19_088680 (plasmid) [Paraburkholderia sp. PGU19]|nr:hypothetical protein PPGU19_088680 [Paraburkholderia sp. PGU19]
MRDRDAALSHFIRPITRNSATPQPRVVPDGVPKQMPEVIVVARPRVRAPARDLLALRALRR